MVWNAFVTNELEILPWRMNDRTDHKRYNQFILKSVNHWGENSQNKNSNIWGSAYRRYFCTGRKRQTFMIAYSQDELMIGKTKYCFESDYVKKYHQQDDWKYDHNTRRLISNYRQLNLKVSQFIYCYHQHSFESFGRPCGLQSRGHISGGTV